MFGKKRIELQPASDGKSMQPFVDWLSTFSTLTPKNVFEIGANMAQDAEWVRQALLLDHKDVWVFEPHPQLVEHITNNYDFNTFGLAVGNKTGPVSFNAIDLTKNSNSGISSLRVHNDVPEADFIPITTEGIRMDGFMKEHKIETIDFLKLDVEGCNFEVLEGFGNRISDIQSLHVEAEHYEHWQGEKLWGELRELLEQHMEMVFFERHFTQSDSFWIKREYIRSQ